MFDSGVCLPLNKGTELNLKKNQKSNSEKLNLSMNKNEDFSGKKTHKKLSKNIKEKTLLHIKILS